MSRAARCALAVTALVMAAAAAAALLISPWLLLIWPVSLALLAGLAIARGKGGDR